jgi:hypothetical protein
MALEAERIYPHCLTVISVVPIGGLTEAELLAQLQLQRNSTERLDR